MLDSGKQTRRGFLASLGAGALVVGFDPSTRRWIGHAEASSCPSFANAPSLDGTLHLDESTRAANATDQGKIYHQTPCAVLRPGSTSDIQKMVVFCRSHGIKVAMRGQGHHMGGFGLSPGLVIEASSMRTIHSIEPDRAVVDMGVTWKDILEQTVPIGLRPPVLTGYAELSVGGVLSIGGTSGVYDEGTKVEHVRELTVVTGQGQAVECSDSQRPQLFNSVLGGLGQCGLITRATVDLVPVEPKARQYQFHYTSNAAYFRDLRTILNRGEIPYAFTLFFPTPTGWVYQLNLGVFYDPSNPPNDRYLLRGLTRPWLLATKTDMDALDYALIVDTQVELYRTVMNWDKLIKPWVVMLLPDSTAEQYVGDVMSQLDAFDLGPGGFIVLFSMRRSAMTRPLPRTPDASMGDWVHNFGVLTSSATPGPDPHFVDYMLDRNRYLYEDGRASGGVRYPIGAVPFAPQDWKQHFGDFWPEFERRKQQYDPDNILTPGPGIFG